MWGTFIDSGVSRHEAQQWCLTHAFELVELNPEELPDEDGEFGQKSDSKMSDCTEHIHINCVFHVLCHTCFCYLSDDFPESTGVKRIVQALNANVWTSVQMKDGEVTSHWNSTLDFESCSLYVHWRWIVSVLVRTQSRLWSNDEFGCVQTQQSTLLHLSWDSGQCKILQPNTW